VTRIDAAWLTDPAVQAVCTMLTDGGHQAWFVGGCVRNALLDVAATDIDLTTSAHPEQVIELAKGAGLKFIPTGIDHGTVTVLSSGTPVEITTFRRDVSTDGRRATVAFSDDITEDAARRDFTMNALYAAPDGTVSDPLGGLPDLQARRVRFIGEADARIAEDYLRILRFFRFTALYGDPDQGIDQEGLAACASGLDGLGHVSPERIGAEMRKLLSAPDPAPALAAMRASGVLMRLLPGAGTGLITVLIHVEQSAGLNPDAMRRLAALGGEGAADAFRLSNAETAKLARLTEALQNTVPAGVLGYRLGEDEAKSALVLRAAAFEREVDPDDLTRATDGARKKFPIKAADLMPAFEGPALGAELTRLETKWLNSGFALGRDQLLSD